MARLLVLAAVTAGCLCGTTPAFAQSNENPMGLDYGSFHPAVPPQVTTYYPPSPAPLGPRRHHRLRRPSY